MIALPALTIGELPFRERPVLELLALQHERATVDHDYAGYGWARVDRLWLVTGDAPGQPDARALDDVLLLALHSADDGEALPDDVELEFELPARPPVAVLASLFLARWVPRLPDASAIVLALCNPHHATLRRPDGETRPVHYADGDVTSWLDLEGHRVLDAPRIELVAGAWRTV